MIPETQTVVSGSTLKLALSSDVTINDMNLPSGTLIYGTASISNERLEIDINSIRYQNSILPVSLSVYDMDGQKKEYLFQGLLTELWLKNLQTKLLTAWMPQWFILQLAHRLQAQELKLLNH